MSGHATYGSTKDSKLFAHIVTSGDFSQRQLRVGELIKQSLGQIFLRDEAKVTSLDTKNITVTEVRMSPDLKNARA